MCVYDTISAPIRYVDSLEKKQHILLFYEDQEYARIIEFRFIKNGLDSQENCIYVTDEDSGQVVLKFLSYGIPLHYFQSGKLQVIQIRNMFTDKNEITSRSKKDAEMILGQLIPPFRIVGRIVPNVSTINGMSVELEFERKTHDCFEESRGSIMCTYDLSKIEKTQRKKWMEDLRQNHHATIYATKFGEGGVFCSC
ncbi:protein of unknown function [Nitrosotalea devaniterrae]|uniref:MEDS domain-containing protein n=1 Tax=Nitrosotalea devaniterrae TaxID=1078905 RepID=A0A128A419_9ARCH|nr:protein of unknown function [Candidatus Nitrosotalea devanaterra]